jgi:hypothetical protein
MSPGSLKGASVGSPLLFVRRLPSRRTSYEPLSFVRRVPVAPHRLGACSRFSGGFRLMVGRAASLGSHFR